MRLPARLNSDHVCRCFHLTARNGANAKQFAAWSGLEPQDCACEVQRLLSEVQHTTHWPKLKALVKSIDSPSTIIASCKSIQALKMPGKSCFASNSKLSAMRLNIPARSAQGDGGSFNIGNL